MAESFFASQISRDGGVGVKEMPHYERPWDVLPRNGAGQAGAAGVSEEGVGGYYYRWFRGLCRTLEGKVAPYGHTDNQDYNAYNE